MNARVIGVVMVWFAAINCGGGSKAGSGAAGASGSLGTAGTGGGGGAGIAGGGGVGGSAGATGIGGIAGSAGAGGSAGGGGTAGSAGAGGSAGGGSAGSAAGTSGSGGSGGMTDGGSDADAWIANGCATSTPPASALISDFETADGGIAVIPGGAMTVSGFTSSTSLVQDGVWHVDGSTSFATPPRGTLVFNSCVDARGYDGIMFSVTGREFLCSLSFAIIDTAHATAGAPLPNASGPADAKPHSYAFELPLWSDAAPTTTTFRFPFSQAGFGGFGAVPPNPTALTDPSKLIALQWIFSAFPTESCGVDARIDDVKFYKDDGDGGSDAPAD